MIIHNIDSKFDMPQNDTPGVKISCIKDFCYIL